LFGEFEKILELLSCGASVVRRRSNEKYHRTFMRKIIAITQFTLDGVMQARRCRGGSLEKLTPQN
jgi:hypothetical protein